MSFSTPVFASLCKTYTTWTSLKAFLMSEEGGRLRVVENQQGDSTEHAIVRYTKGVSDFSKVHVPYFRSVVWNTTTNRPVSVAPPKAEQADVRAEVAVRCTDFVEGTMIQGWREVGHAPRLATRTSLDAKGGFYSKRSFAELFADAVQGGTDAFLSSVLQDNQFISFVLQHKDHRIVAPIAASRLFVVYVGSVLEDGTVHMTAMPNEWPAALTAFAPHVYSDSMTFQTLQSAETFFRKENSVYTWQGMVFQEIGSGSRWRMRNPNYVKVRTLRGSEAVAGARFLRLRSTGQIKEYLKYYREENNTMWTLEQTWRERTCELYDCYVQMHKLKTKGMRDFPYSLRPHVYALHGTYLASLGQEQGPVAVQKEAVIGYVNNLSLEEQVKILVGDTVRSSVQTHM